MIKDIEISNFRCFEHTKIAGFERVNLIGGKNNSGKTALLEAIFLYSYPYPSSILEIREAIRNESLEAVRAIPKNAWDNFLFNLDQENIIELKGSQYNPRMKGLQGDRDSHYTRKYIANLGNLSTPKKRNFLITDNQSF
jgi:AAA15 family ATPase/GTPase